MGFRFRKSVKIAPGIKLNLGKNGVSASIGPKGAKVTIGSNGTRKTLGLPGTGLSFTETTSSSVSKDSTGTYYLKECPYCGRKMRKRWENCPKCHEILPQPSTDQNNQSNFSTRKPVANTGCLLHILSLTAVLYLLL